MKQNITWPVATLLFIVTLLLSSLLFWRLPAEEALAAPAPNELTGFAWSSNIGWISFNGSATDGSHYAVSVDQATGALSGYAWSSNIGWISFGDAANGKPLSSFPVGNGTQSATPKLVPDATGYHLEGWIRACAGTASGDCSTMNSRTDGWDGWISLRGVATDGSPYGIHLDNTGVVDNSEHFAWGDDVVGWVSFKDSVNGFYEVTFPTLLPDLTVAGYRVTLSPGYDLVTGAYDYLDIHYSVHNSGLTAVGAFDNEITLDTTTLTDTVPGIVAGSDSAVRTVRFNNVSIGAHTITIVANTSNPGLDETDRTNNTQGPDTYSVPIPPPDLTLKISPNTVVRYNSDIKITWDLGGAEYLDSCTLAGPNVTGSPKTIYTNGDATTGIETVGPITHQSTYLLACQAAGQTFSATSTVKTTGLLQEI